MYYAGETSRTLRKRLFEHKSSVIKDRQITPVSYHFKNDGHSHKYHQPPILKQDSSNIEYQSTSAHAQNQASTSNTITHCIENTTSIFPGETD